MWKDIKHWKMCTLCPVIKPPPPNNYPGKKPRFLEVWNVCIFQKLSAWILFFSTKMSKKQVIIKWVYEGKTMKKALFFYNFL